MRRACLLALAAAAVVTAGCGTSGGPAEDVRGTVQAFLFNCRHGDGPSAQEVLTEPARAVFVDRAGVDRGCARILSQASVDAGELARAHVAAVHVSSGRARADVALAGATASVTLAQGREGWLIEAPR